jgi:hypothetical protein
MDPEWKKGEYKAQPIVGLSGQLVINVYGEQCNGKNQHQQEKKQRKC